MTTFGVCRYGRDEPVKYPYEIFLPGQYECPFNACSEKGLCEFHDEEYAQTNAETVMDLFYTWLQQQLEKQEPIFCIGFCFPKEVDLTLKNITTSIHFTFSKFK